MSRFVLEAARGFNEWFLYLLTVVIVIGALFLGQLPAIYVVNNKLYSGNVDPSVIEGFWNSPDFSLLGIPSWQGLALMLLGHVAAALALYVCVRAFHKRQFMSVITSRKPFDWRRLWVGFGLWMGLTILLEVFMYFIDPTNYRFQLDLNQWLPVMLVCLTIIPIQTSIEEVLIRGYLLQGVGLATRSGITAIVVTSVIFVVMHLANPEVQSFGVGVMTVYYFSVAVFLGVLTLLDEGLELALGVHAATNIYGASFVTFDGSVMQTDAMFKVLDVNAWWMTLGFGIMILVFSLIVRKLYPFKPVSALFEPIDLNDYTEIENIHERSNSIHGSDSAIDDISE
jgi:membrane protease YdiL (CAAX protease family)